MESEDIAKSLRKITKDFTPLEKIIPNKDLQKTIIAFLRVFNCIETKNQQIRAVSEIAENFLKSLSIYIEQKLPLISDWDSKGSEYIDFISAENFLKKGVQLTYEIEKKRNELSENAIPIERTQIEVLLIKAKTKGDGKEKFLFQYSPRANKYMLLGGYKNENDTSEDKIVKRFIGKELPNNFFTYTHKKVVEYKTKQISHKNGIITEYDITMHYISDIDIKNLRLSNKDMWLSLDQMKDLVLGNGIYIQSPFTSIADPDESKHIEEVLTNLPLSISEKQEETSPIYYENKKEDERKTKELLGEEESETLEFKSTIRFDIKQNIVNKGLEQVIVKSIVAMLNTNGGNLVIGLDDNGTVLGLENDMQTLRKKDVDGLMLHLVNLVNDCIGVEVHKFLEIKFYTIENKVICIIKISRSPEPIFIKNGNNSAFAVRTGNSTKVLNPEETYKFILANW